MKNFNEHLWLCSCCPSSGTPHGQQELSSNVSAEAYVGYSDSATFCLPSRYCRSNVLILFGFCKVYRAARSQNKQLSCVTNTTRLCPRKSLQLVISNKPSEVNSLWISVCLHLAHVGRQCLPLEEHWQRFDADVKIYNIPSSSSPPTVL